MSGLRWGGADTPNAITSAEREKSAGQGATEPKQIEKKFPQAHFIRDYSYAPVRRPSPASCEPTRHRAVWQLLAHQSFVAKQYILPAARRWQPRPAYVHTHSGSDHRRDGLRRNKRLSQKSGGLETSGWTGTRCNGHGFFAIGVREVSFFDNMRLNDDFGGLRTASWTSNTKHHRCRGTSEFV